ncbi:MAG: nucleotidyltransferase domain-containing protein [Reyranella sp.]|nr:nucleotidyltransferase domain-containing protein [Reyranella sp.]
MPPDLALAREYKRRVDEAFNGRVAKMVLFGSRARGEAHTESDWDIVVFLADNPTMEDRHRLADLGSDVLMDTGQVIQSVALPLRREAEDSYLMRAIRAEGINL